MGPAERQAVEDELAALLARRELSRAATLALHAFGPEILTLLTSMHGNRHDADDAFSIFCEALWKGLPGFEARSALRTWMYAIARNASHRLHERRRDREVLVSDAQFEQMMAQLRTTSRSAMARSHMQRLRERLDPDDQLLLILRVDRELDWKDLARVMNHGVDLDEATLARESARLRKRFQSIRERLRAWIALESSG